MDDGLHSQEMAAPCIMTGTELPKSKARQLEGVVAYFYAFDIAYDMQQRPVATLLGQRLRHPDLRL